jgi:hypothetical protein
MRKDLALDLRRVRKRIKEFRSLATDPWIKANSEIEAQRLHALGVIVFRWNLSEQKLFHLFWALLDRPESEVVALGHEVNDIGLAARIRALAIGRLSANAKLCDAIENAIDVFEVCRQNRNQLAHFYPVLAFAALEKRPIICLHGTSNAESEIPSPSSNCRSPTRPATFGVSLRTYNV